MTFYDGAAYSYPYMADSVYASAPRTSTFGQVHHFLHRSSKQAFAARLRSGARSITQGGWNSEYGIDDEEAWKNLSLVKRAWLEDFHPRSVMRRGPTQFAFNPFQRQLGPNMLFYKDMEPGADRLGKPLEKRLNKSARDAKGNLDHSSWVRRAGLLDSEGNLSHMWDPKMLTRISAASDFAKADTLSANQMKNLNSFLKISKNENMASALAEHADEVTGKVAAQATRLSTVGTLSGRLMGGFEGLRFGEEGVHKAIRGNASEAVRAGLKWGSGIRSWGVDENGEKLAYKSILKREATSQAEKLGAEKLGTTVGEDVAKKGAGIVAKQLGSRAAIFGAEALGAAGEAGLNPVMDILAVAGFVQLGLGALSGIAHLGADVVGGAMKSIRGGIGQGPFGAGFKDTAAASTSRARGVMAIQASRLNARSLLGSEAAMMHSYYSS